VSEIIIIQNKNMVYITDYAEFQAKALELLQRDPTKV
jgi:hypothetical protein